ncbi:hypothetical protein MA16_Dca019949 [Dendrobium catenatum]|uniref:Integrase catalytic domain-containing protein n=1 Tax=Dendrobium catenatum TaxID=906689 RepID=A0A2I0WHA2_9ASPA|nr:hypothetical protein MA16_Dca019949 [Dendrobium catenatum]
MPFRLKNAGVTYQCLMNKVFKDLIFTAFCKDLHIQLVHTAVAHPQANSQTDVTNRTTLKGLKTRLEKAGGHAAYHQRIAHHYNQKVKPQCISVGDLVLRSLEAAGKDPQCNKLSPLWEGPYMVSSMVKPETFKLKDRDRKMLPRT